MIILELKVCFFYIFYFYIMFKSVDCILKEDSFLGGFLVVYHQISWMLRKALLISQNPGSRIRQLHQFGKADESFITVSVVHAAKVIGSSGNVETSLHVAYHLPHIGYATEFANRCLQFFSFLESLKQVYRQVPVQFPRTVW